jgi:hypothetical protein
VTASRDLRYDPYGAEWHNSILDAPDEAVLCWGWGHRWDAVKKDPRKSAHGIPLEDVVLTCRSCGRVRHVALTLNGHDIFSSNYSNGHRLRTGNALVREAREEWSRREGARAKAAGPGPARGGCRRRAPPPRPGPTASAASPRGSTSSRRARTSRPMS